jgi:glutaconyl-CoA/methylmalonyl-CoA decarboxylase subunit gamma
MPESKNVTTLVIGDTAYETTLTRKFLLRKRYEPSDPRLVIAHIPGVIQAVRVKPGDAVRRGAPLLVLEAMKMANDLTAPLDGTVRAVHVHTGQMVARGECLLELE